MDEQDYNQPVAYDSEGRPLYAHPPKKTNVKPSPPKQQAMGNVHVARPLEIAQMQVSDELRAKHEASIKRYPNLNLSDGEYVISAVRRHLIGLAIPVILTSLLFVIVLGAMLAYSFLADSLQSSNVSVPQTGDILLFGMLILMLIGIGGYIVVWIYINNRFFLTNESVIQEMQTGLFAKREQTVSLENIEDASYHQAGLIQTFFDYGSIRLSTEGDETTYRFRYVARPKQQIAKLNNAVEAFKLGRAVVD